jgi:hypothetical protein
VIRRIIPVLTTLRYLPQNGVLRQWYMAIAKSDPESAEISDDIRFINLPELEAALMLKKSGTRFSDVMEEWRASEYVSDPLVNYLSYTDRWPGRHPMLEGWMVEAFRSFGQLLFGNPDVITIPGEPKDMTSDA